MSIKLTSEKGAALLLCGLSLERCAMYVAHLCASVHLADGPEDAILEIIAGMERELSFSRKLLRQSASE